MFRLLPLCILALFLSIAPAQAVAPWAQILIIGDSISQGKGATTPANSYPAVLARLTGASMTGASNTAVNLRGAVGQWATLRGPWPVVVVEVGINDALGLHDWLPLPEWQTTYAGLLADMRTAGVGQVVIVTPGPDSDAAPAAAAYAEATRALAGGGVAVADTWPALAGVAGVYTSDGIHPNDAGHARIAQAIADVLEWRVYLPITRT